MFILSCFFMLVANCLTDVRASFFALSIVISGILCLGIWHLHYSQNKYPYTRKKSVVIIIFLFLCFCLCFYGAVEGQRYLGPKFIEIRNNGGIISIALAENPTEETDISLLPDFMQRNVWIANDANINQSLTGRFAIWEKAFQYISNHPDCLSFGLSIDGSVASTVNRPDHSHNILLQILLEGGIPALLLYLALVFYSIFHAFRLWSRKGVSFWQRILPLPVFSILLWEMAECLTHFSFGHPPMTLFWFFLGATITVGKALGKAPKTIEQPAIPAESAVTETGE